MEELDTPKVETPPVEPQPAPATTNRTTLAIIVTVVVIDLLGFAIVLPLLPRYGREFIPGGKENPAYGLILGALMASFSAMQFIFMPIWGRMSDRIGRRPILLMGLFGTVMFYVLFGYASSLDPKVHGLLALWGLFLARIGAGISGATIGTAQAAIADSTTSEGRSRGMALIGMAFGIGFFFGPLLGALALALFPNHPGSPGYLAAGLSLVALVVGYVKLPETLRPGVTSHVVRQWLNLKGWRTAAGVPGVTLSIVIFFLSSFAFANFESTLTLLNEEKGLGLSAKYNFFVFAYIGFVLAFVMGVVYRRLARRISEIRFMKMGAVLMGLGLGGIGIIAYVASTAVESSMFLLASLLGILIVAITGFGFMTPSAQALVSRLSDPARQGEVLGINQSMNAVARILGPAIGMPLYALSSTHSLPYFFGFGVFVVVLGLVIVLSRKDAVAHLDKEAPYAA